MNKYCTYVDEQKVPLSATIKVTFDFMAICPILVPSKPYGGKISISYTPKNEDSKLRLLEWDSFNEWIRSLILNLASAEEMAHIVICEFLKNIDPESATLHMMISTPFHLPVDITLTYQAKR